MASSYSFLIDPLLAIAVEAGKKIMEIYQDTASWNVVMKEDKSPLTMADKEAHLIIEKGLIDLSESFPIISEEGRDIPFEKRKHWPTFWLVDPLDGTKEFIKRNGQFTVNIALIDDQSPVLGVIYAPASEELFYGVKGEGAFKINEDGKPVRLHTSKRTLQLISVGSSSHVSEEEAIHLDKYDIAHVIKSGSSLKFCKVAEGAADLYVRTGPTMEWDTAAGQCIAESAGGVMSKLDGSPFLYNKENLLNTGFVCTSGVLG